MEKFISNLREREKERERESMIVTKNDGPWRIVESLCRDRAASWLVLLLCFHIISPCAFITTWLLGSYTFYDISFLSLTQNAIPKQIQKKRQTQKQRAKGLILENNKIVYLPCKKQQSCALSFNKWHMQFWIITLAPTLKSKQQASAEWLFPA